MDGKTELLAAIIAGRARWEPFPKSPTLAGEVCVDGLRYFTQLGPNGCPKITEHIHRALTKSRTESFPNRRPT